MKRSFISYLIMFGLAGGFVSCSLNNRTVGVCRATNSDNNADLESTTPLKGGSVSAAQYVPMPGVSSYPSSYDVGAGFYDYTNGPYPVCCTITTSGPCQVLTCPNHSCIGHMSPTAGTITITGGLNRISMTGLSIYAASGTTSLWNGGETLTFAAAGADVPAFSGVLIAPTPVAITSLPLPATSPLNFSRISPPDIKWTSSTNADKVQISVTNPGSLASGPSVMAVICTYDAKAGHAQFPTDVFCNLTPGIGSIGFGTSNEKTIVAEDWSVTIKATTFIGDNSSSWLNGEAAQLNIW